MNFKPYILLFLLFYLQIFKQEFLSLKLVYKRGVEIYAFNVLWSYLCYW